MAEKQDFLGRVRLALGRDPEMERPAPGALGFGEDAPFLLHADKAERRTREERLAMVPSMVEAAGRVRLEARLVSGVEEAAAGIRDIIAKHAPEWSEEKQICAWDHPLVNAVTAELGGGVVRPEAGEADFPGRIRNAFLGITAADLVVAETGTMVLFSGPGRPRSVSLLPSIHVAAAPLDALAADFTELYAVLHKRRRTAGPGLPDSFVFVSGPSKTADIEVVMVHGAHGPGAAYLFLLE